MPIGSKTDAFESTVLNNLYRNTATGLPATVYLGAFTVAPSETGGGTEVSGNAYARVAIDRSSTPVFGASAAGSAMTNGSQISFPVATPGAWGTIVAVGIFDASTAGNLLSYGYLVGASKVGISAAADLTPNTIQIPGHGYTALQALRVFTVESFTLPAPLADGTLYYVTSSSPAVATDTFGLSATSGGAAVDITAAGTLRVAADASKVIGANDQLVFPASTGITISED